MYHDLVFRRGYLITERGDDTSPPARVDEWGTDHLDEFVVTSHPELAVRTLEGDRYALAMIGTVVDPINDTADTAVILERARRRISTDLVDFYDYLDALSGRFALFVHGKSERGRGTFAVQDATGTRSLYYDVHASRCRLSSHPEILARMGGYDRSALIEFMSRVDSAAYPGTSTPYTEIKRLMPNTRLRLPSGDVERFFPREPLPERELTDELVDDVAELLTTQLRLLNEDYELAMSLSAGLDSRVSLAATREIADDVEYYTYDVSGNDYAESETTGQLCEALGLDRQIIDLSDEPPPEFIELFSQHTSDMSTMGRRREMYNLLKEFPSDRLELRSNVAEVARTFYKKHLVAAPNRIRAETFQKLYFQAMSAQVLREFEELIETTSFTSEDIYNYDPYDLFYWEQRMGSWLALWLLEMDVSHDNFVVYNNRTLLKKMLSVDLEHRRSDALFYRLIETLWPECLSVPINPHEPKPSELSTMLKRTAYGLAFRMPLSVYRPLVRRLR